MTRASVLLSLSLVVACDGSATIQRPSLPDRATWGAMTGPDRIAWAMRFATSEADFVEYLRSEPIPSDEPDQVVPIWRHRESQVDFVYVPPPSGATSGFLMARTELSQESWNRVMPTNPSKFPRSAYPVESVSWDESVAYCARFGFTLPTVAEWQWACESDPWATHPRLRRLRRSGIWAAQFEPRTIGEHRQSGWGLYDLLGSVWEWCVDEGVETNAGAHAVMGGGFRDSATRATCNQPGWCREGQLDVGFRPVVHVPTRKPK